MPAVRAFSTASRRSRLVFNLPSCAGTQLCAWMLAAFWRGSEPPCFRPSVFVRLYGTAFRLYQRYCVQCAPSIFGRTCEWFSHRCKLERSRTVFSPLPGFPPSRATWPAGSAPTCCMVVNTDARERRTRRSTTLQSHRAKVVLSFMVLFTIDAVLNFRFGSTLSLAV